MNTNDFNAVGVHGRDRATVAAVPPGGVADSSDNAIRQNLSNAAYSSIRASLMSCSLRPGHRLILRPLARRLGLSPTPVREALLRLVSEQALTLDERGSAMVPIMTVDNYNELIQLRIDLESRAMERAVAIAGDAEIEALEAANDPVMKAYTANDLLTLADHNLAFHRAICVAGRSWLTLNALQGLWMRLGPIYAPSIGDTMPTFAPETHPHVCMIDAIRKRDVKAARAAALDDVMIAYRHGAANVAALAG